MNIIRKLKISEIVPVKFNETEQKIIDIYNDKLSYLVIFIDDSKPWQINYMKPDGTFIMQQDNKLNRLWIRFDRFWEVLYYNFGMEYSDIRILMKYMVERAFKQKVSIPYTFGGIVELIEIERTFQTKNNITKLQNIQY